MVMWVCGGVLVMLSVPAAVAAFVLYIRWYVLHHFLDNLTRVFRERPLFIMPRGEPVHDAEDVSLRTPDGLTLRGCYLRGEGPRRGVILFGLEFGSERWSCVQYCEHLVHAGYDVFAFEPRNQGESDVQPGYEQLQWPTNLDLIDTRAALAYLKARPDADPRGVGLFGISKGGCVGLLAAVNDPYIRCAATDGIFAIHTTMLPYMRKWIAIYSTKKELQALMPAWFYRWAAVAGIRKAEGEIDARFLHLEPAVRRFRRPLLMIHGSGDTYIKPGMAKSLFDLASGEKEFWVVPGAKHNQAIHVAGAEYHRRVIEFFDRHLAEKSVASASESEADPALAAH